MSTAYLSVRYKQFFIIRFLFYILFYCTWGLSQSAVRAKTSGEIICKMSHCARALSLSAITFLLNCVRVKGYNGTFTRTQHACT